MKVDKNEPIIKQEYRGLIKSGIPVRLEIASKVMPAILHSILDAVTNKTNEDVLVNNRRAIAGAALKMADTLIDLHNETSGGKK